LAQVPAPTATLAHVEGIVYLDQQLIAATSSAVTLADSATIRTGTGRAVVALKRGGMLALNGQSAVRVLSNGSYNFNRIELLQGSAVVITGTTAPVVSCRSNTHLSSGGTFRFDMQPAEPNGTTTCRFRVYDGAAAVPLATLTAALRSGQAMKLDPACGDMIPTTTFSPGELEEFDRWSRQMAEGRR